MKRFPKDARAIPEFAVFKKLTTPSKIQDFLDTLPINFEKGGESNYSPLTSLRKGRVHCFEGALLAAAALWYQGQEPLLLDLETTSYDVSHVVALFRRGGRWGAIAKSNHAVLRYRDPIFLSVRELAASYFNEYFLYDGEKTLRSFAGPFSLLRFDPQWLWMKDNTWHIVNALNASKHFPILPKQSIRLLRRADKIERQVARVREWER